MLTTINKKVCYLSFKTIVNASFRCPRLNHATLDLSFCPKSLTRSVKHIRMLPKQFWGTDAYNRLLSHLSPYFWWRSKRYSCRLQAFEMSAKFPSLYIRKRHEQFPASNLIILFTVDKSFKNLRLKLLYVCVLKAFYYLPMTINAFITAEIKFTKAKKIQNPQLPGDWSYNSLLTIYGFI